MWQITRRFAKFIWLELRSLSYGTPRDNPGDVHRNTILRTLKASKKRDSLLFFCRKLLLKLIYL